MFCCRMSKQELLDETKHHNAGNSLADRLNNNMKNYNLYFKYCLTIRKRGINGKAKNRLPV